MVEIGEKTMIEVTFPDMFEITGEDSAPDLTQ